MYSVNELHIYHETIWNYVKDNIGKGCLNSLKHRGLEEAGLNTTLPNCCIGCYVDKALGSDNCRNCPFDKFICKANMSLYDVVARLTNTLGYYDLSSDVYRKLETICKECCDEIISAKFNPKIIEKYMRLIEVK